MKKKNPEPFSARFENTMENPFFDFVKYRSRRSNFFLNSNYIVLNEKKALRFNFGPWEVPQPKNMHFHFYAFSGWGTSQGPKLNLKAFFS